MTLGRKLALVGVAIAIATAWYPAEAIRLGGVAALAVVVLWLAVGIWAVEMLERRPP